MKNILKLIKNIFQKKRTKKERYKINAQEFFNRINTVTSEFGKLMDRDAHLMYSNESKLPYSKKVILDSLKVFISFYFFNKKDTQLNAYMVAYNNLSTYQKIIKEDQDKMKFFNDTNYIQEENQLTQDKLKENNNEINDEVKKTILAQAQRISKNDNKIIQNYAELSNKENKKNEMELGKFFFEAQEYLKNEGLTESHFANFNNLFNYLNENKRSFVETLYNSI
ncbi:MAG TPA: hypothetical protein VKN74_01670 [Candidatus Mcinerneyibacterium sp.]|nr:hypothetical protein [Candidatus Mcinerneyibacterium sp.]